MPKPIVVITIPALTKEKGKEIYENKRILDLKEEYHVFILGCPPAPNKQVTWEVFYEKDFNEVKYEELKKIIKDKVK